MRALPISARLYVSSVILIGAGLLVSLGQRDTFADPVLFLVLLLASALTSAFKVSLRLARGALSIYV